MSKLLDKTIIENDYDNKIKLHFEDMYLEIELYDDNKVAYKTIRKLKEGKKYNIIFKEDTI